MSSHLQEFDALSRITAQQLKNGHSRANGDGSDFAETASHDWGQSKLGATEALENEPYPLDALPTLILEAVAEVQAFVKAPTPLVAASALSAVSLASQGIASVERATGLVSPCSLFFITIADSGERKSTCDRLFIDPIRRWQIDEAKRLDPEVKEHKAKYAAWKAEKDGLELLIKQQARKQQSTVKSQADLADAMGREPIAPRLPDLIYADTTPEALAFGLSKWPSGGLMAHEGGVVLGSHGMNAEAVMRNLSLLDSLWDGMPHQVRRRTSDSFELINARLTIGLQVQPAAFRAFYERTGGISRGIGFLARCLLSWPTSTQGSRTYSEPPEAWPGLNAFQERITALLNFPLSFDESGHLSIPVIALNPSAKDSWIAFHNEVESMLVDGQMLADIRDVGSKAADNAARLACLFQIFESGVTKVGVVAMEDAIRIVRWHLKEARRFLLYMEQAEELVDAERIRQWLTNYVRTSRQTSVDKNHVRQVGPLRSSSRLSLAITELEDQGFVSEMKHGRKTIIVIHKESAHVN